MPESETAGVELSAGGVVFAALPASVPSVVFVTPAALPESGVDVPKTWPLLSEGSVWPAEAGVEEAAPELSEAGVEEELESAAAPPPELSEAPLPDDGCCAPELLFPAEPAPEELLFAITTSCDCEFVVTGCATAIQSKLVSALTGWLVWMVKPAAVLLITP